MHLRGLIAIVVITICFLACKNDNSVEETSKKEIAETVKEKVLEFGFDLEHYEFKKDTVRKGDTFGIILERNNIGYPKIFQIAEKAKDTFTQPNL